MNEQEKEKFLKIETGAVTGFPEKEPLGPDAQIVVDQKRGVIVKIGNPREINEWLKGLESQKALGLHPGYELTNLSVKDSEIIPGLVDTHTHPVLYSMLEAVEPQYLFGIKEKEKLIKALKERYQKDREPVLGLGWDTVALRDLSGDDLDEVCNNEPIIVIDPSFHGGIVNSKGREILGRLAENYEKENKTKLRGELSSTGRITEEFVTLALNFFESRRTVEQTSETTVKWLERELSHGITDTHDMFLSTPQELSSLLMAIEKWKGKYKEQEFPISRFFVRPVILKQIERQATSLIGIGDKFRTLIEKRVVGIKLLADGSIGSYTAEVSEPYLDKDTQGIQFDTIKEAQEAFRLAKEMGISEIATHAIGDKAIKRAIEYAKYWLQGGEERKFRIEHYEMSGRSDILEETKEAGIWVSSQPNFVTDVVHYEKKLGRERAIILCPHQHIVKSGIPMMFGTDGMPQNMLFAIWCAVHHPNAAERLSLEEAVIASAAMAGEWEKSKRGRFAEGAPADFVVMDPKTMDHLLRKEMSDEEIRSIIGSDEKISDLTKQLDEGVRIVIKSGKIVKALKE